VTTFRLAGSTGVPGRPRTPPLHRLGNPSGSFNAVASASRRNMSGDLPSEARTHSLSLRTAIHAAMPQRSCATGRLDVAAHQTAHAVVDAAACRRSVCVSPIPIQKSRHPCLSDSRRSRSRDHGILACRKPTTLSSVDMKCTAGANWHARTNTFADADRAAPSANTIGL
jgi:hypothetical protein